MRLAGQDPRIVKSLTDVLQSIVKLLYEPLTNADFSIYSSANLHSARNFDFDRDL